MPEPFVGLLPHTIMSDNGNGLVRHRSILKLFAAPFYFARAHHSRKHGPEGNTNGLFREYFPKPMDFQWVAPEALRVGSGRHQQPAQ